MTPPFRDPHDVDRPVTCETLSLIHAMTTSRARPMVVVSGYIRESLGGCFRGSGTLGFKLFISIKNFLIKGSP